MFRAVRDNVMARIDGNNSIQGGGSTITQQVAKNFLLTSEQTWDRKIQEAMLAVRIESTFSKDKILELYLNEIFLGLNSYGVAAAALNYFDKALYELTLSEAAYIAALPKGPNNYHPFRRPQAGHRAPQLGDRSHGREWLRRPPKRREAAKDEPLNVMPRARGSQLYLGRVFHRGSAPPARQALWRRPSSMAAAFRCAPRSSRKLQEYARQALMDGLISYDHSEGFRGPVASVEIADGLGRRRSTRSSR